jgi:hypothetical protein
MLIFNNRDITHRGIEFKSGVNAGEWEAMDERRVITTIMQIQVVESGLPAKYYAT